MPNGHTDGNDRGQQAANRVLRRGILWFAVFMLLLAVCMFGAAGQIGWTRGWVFLVTYLTLTIATLIYLWRTNPEIVVARSMPHRGAKGWDKVLFLLISASFTAMFPVAGIDDGRFHCSVVPLWLTAVGYLLLLIGMAGTAWVFRVNKFAEPRVRIQTERKQQVIDTGPYAIVRHPLYAVSFFLFAGIPLCLGSFWALVPAAVVTLVLIVRTVLEDRMLQNELDGYREYASRVRCRLVPGIW
jgi:protein-S-isoprenylcysteine O-methyltransferase Ste14